MTGPQVPDGVRAALAVGDVAKVLNTDVSQVQGWVTNGALPSFRVIPGKGWRLVRSADVAELAELHNLPLNWETVL